MYWVDLDNTPHVPLFRPILAALASRGIETLVTSRKHAQTEDLLRLWNIPHTAVGVHGGKNTARKVLNLAHRATSLARLVTGREVALSVSHGSRSHLVASWMRGIPYVEMNDYEFSEHRLANALADVLLFPVYIPDERLRSAGHLMRKVVRYSGFKEQIYLRDFAPAQGFRKTLGIPDDIILVTMRPPSTSANYHDPRSEELFRRCLTHFANQKDTLCLVVNRTESERRLVAAELIARGNVRFLDVPVDGLQLVWHSDVVISGGGTMNRESGLLGIPTYSIFTGRRPYLDEYLQEHGRLVFIEQTKDVDTIPVVRRKEALLFPSKGVDLVAEIVSLLEDFARTHSRVTLARTAV